MEKIKVLAIMGEAGSGKDTVAAQLLEACPEKCSNVVSYTTRPMRAGEKDGINYWYVDNESYLNMIKTEDMLESTCFNGWYYGTPLSAYSKSKVNVVVMNPEGVRALEVHPAIDLVVVRLKVSPKERLIRQLQREKDPNVEEIIRRWGTDKADFIDADALADIIYSNETGADLCQAVRNLAFLVDSWTKVNNPA